MMLMPNFEIIEGDNLSRQVCEDCFNKINDFDTFKSMCEYSQDRMKTCVTVKLENGDMKNFETWRSSSEEIIPGISNPWEEEDEKTEVKINCKKEHADEYKYFEIKIEDPAEEYNCEVIKSEPESEIRTPDETYKTENMPVESVSNQSTKTGSPEPDDNKINCVERPYKCKDCGKTFLEKNSFRLHLVTHSGIRAYMCNICGKRFKLPGHLKNHHLTHTGQKSHVCEECGRRFAQLGNLKKHEFLHTGEKPFSCDICGRCFADKYHFQTHLAGHAGQKRYVCDICHKGFLVKGNLTKHLVFHSGEKRFSCDICGNQFFTKGNLIKHLVVHSGEKRFSCDICGTLYAHSDGLKRHKAKHHIHK